MFSLVFLLKGGNRVAATGAAGVCVALSSIIRAQLIWLDLYKEKLAKQGQFILAVMTQSITESVTLRLCEYQSLL